jgi:hypothetical protein
VTHLWGKGGRAGSRRGAVARVRSRVAEAIVLAALVAGWRGSFLGKKPSSIVDGAIRTSRGWTVAHHFYPRIASSYVLLRKNDYEDVNHVVGRFGGVINPPKSPA